MTAFLSRVRERGPQLWGVRLVLGVSLLGLLLAGVWQGEIHSHDNGSVAHLHGHDHETPDTDLPTDGLASESSHIHDAAVTVAMFGPPTNGPELPKLAAAWVPDDPAVHAPPLSFNAPHRPPIA